MKTLVVDVGGTNVKVLCTGLETPVKIPSGSKLTPSRMVKEIKSATGDWSYDNVSIGYPGPVVKGKPAREPWNLGKGWVAYDFKKAFARPVRIVNDAAMQALGSYEGGAMLFLGLGTGLGSAMVRNGTLIPMELAHMPYKHGHTYEEYLGEEGMHKHGKRAWRRHVDKVTQIFIAAFVVDYVVLGGGNAKKLGELPKNARLGSNANAFAGGFRLWDTTAPIRID